MSKLRDKISSLWTSINEKFLRACLGVKIQIIHKDLLNKHTKMYSKIFHLKKTAYWCILIVMMIQLRIQMMHIMMKAQQ